MLDIQFIRDNKDLVKHKSAQKQVKVDIDKLLKLDQELREILQQVEKLRQRRNQVARSQPKAKKIKNENITQGRAIKNELFKLEKKNKSIEQDFFKLLKQVPNMPTDDVPVGDSEADNKVVKTVGEIPNFSFQPKNDAEIGEVNNYIDKTRAAKVSGSRFIYVKNDLVRLEFALIQWTIDLLTDPELLQKIIDDHKLKVTNKPFSPVLPPPMVRTQVYEATARLKAKDTTYKIENEDLWLNASAEHSLVPMYMNEVLPEDQLPIRYLGFATSFRKEAGNYGKDMEGLFRNHHFDKLEMESFAAPEKSFDEHLFLIAIQEHLMSQLKLPYRVLLKCTADIGEPNARGVDIEVWMPSQSSYRETHTADYMTDYQARRLKTRLKRNDGKIELVHTNDATALAMSRTLKAIMENYQNQNGYFAVPEVLKPYLGK